MKKELIFKGRKVNFYVADVKTKSGKVVRRELVEHPGAVVILPLLDDSSVVLEEHYRFAIGESLLEAPAGTLDPGEDPGEAAARELLEETGLKALNWVKLGEFYASPGVMTELMHVYLARHISRRERHLEEDEELETVEMPFDQALEYAANGRIKDAKTIVALFLAKEFLANQTGDRRL